MEEVRTLHSGRLNPPLESTREEWEDWESDDEPLTPMNGRDGPLLNVGEQARQAARRTSLSRSVSSRLSGGRAQRPTSRLRQKAQNAKAGITVITDMSKFQRERQATQRNRESRTGRFLDPAALKALEGTPSQETGGAFGWLRKKAEQSPKGKSPDRLGVQTQPQEDLSPAVGPIMIGFAMPSDSDVVISPQTAVVETPIDFGRYFGKLTKGGSQPAPTSAWSPDSDDGPASRRPNAAEVMSRNLIPAVPSVPEAYRDTQASSTGTNEAGDIYTNRRIERMKRDTKATTIFADDDDDLSTPVTLFEEDGSPLATRKSLKVQGRQRSTTVTSTRSQGWWDQVTTPFTRTPVTPEAPSTIGHDEWWNDADTKHATSVEQKVASPKQKVASPRQWAAPPTSKFAFSEDNLTPTEKQATASKPTLTVERNFDNAYATRDVKKPQVTPRIVIEEVATADVDPSPVSVAMPSQARARTGKAAFALDDEDQGQSSSDGPPPYSPPSQKHNAKYRAFFPPEDPRSSLYQQPPSPSPVSPGLARTMTSQGAIGLRNIPLTPPPAVVHDTGSSRLPDRPQGSFVPSHGPVTGRGERQRIETQRRRHEKEDAIAYNVGGLWKGRGCFPANGCFGRPGREGRRRRRICLLLVVLMLVVIALAIALPLVLIRRNPVVEVPSRFLNLTDFPPMPTGIAAVVGTNSVATTNCVSPSTFWSCSLPKEQADLAAPYDSSKPSFIFHIQFDNSSGQLWNVPQGIPPVPTPVNSGTRTATPSTRARAVEARRGSAGVSSTLQRRQGTAGGFRPDPVPPSFQEMFFLGNTTDRVVSAQKAGEPTPFYISVLSSLDETAGPNVVSRQAQPPANNSQGFVPGFVSLLPPPVLDQDGTAAAAVLLPHPKQQPIRLYDRGLPTERYAFYTYFDKRTFLKSIEPLDSNTASDGNVPADLNGGALKTEANFVISWMSVRYKVEIWTQRLNSTRFLVDNDRPAGNTTRPGTFPYPVTITLDTHGGQPQKKFGFIRGVDERQRVVLTDPKLVANNMNTAGDLINPSNNFNPSFGGMDGGTGGCKCEYTNFVGLNGQI